MILLNTVRVQAGVQVLRLYLSILHWTHACSVQLLTALFRLSAVIKRMDSLTHHIYVAAASSNNSQEYIVGKILVPQ